MRVFLAHFAVSCPSCMPDANAGIYIRHFDFKPFYPSRRLEYLDFFVRRKGNAGAVVSAIFKGFKPVYHNVFCRLSFTDVSDNSAHILLYAHALSLVLAIDTRTFGCYYYSIKK